MEKYSVVYSVALDPHLLIYLPQAWICNTDTHDMPAYIQAAALPENTASYIPEYVGSIHEKLISQCNELSLPKLEQEFNRTKKKPEKLATLFTDTKTQALIKGIVEKRLHKVLNTIRDHQLYLCYDLKRKIKAADILVYFSELPMLPRLRFVKTQTGIQYHLTLLLEDKELIPCEENMVSLTAYPAVLLYRQHIFQLKAISATKLQPFLKNRSVFVPEKLTKTYFEQFVTDVMGKVDVEAEGFEIVRHGTITDATIQFIHDFIHEKWVCEIQFQYGAVSFSNWEGSRRKTRLHVDDAGNIRVYEFTRNEEAEKVYLDLLDKEQFVLNSSQRYAFGSGALDIIVRVGQCYNTLSPHFRIQFPEIDGKKIHQHQLQVHTDYALENDWFDLRGTVRIGEHSFPISVFFEYIRQNNPFFRLPDGTYTIIPEEWMAKLSPLITYAVVQQPYWRLSKKHFTLLEAVSETEINAHHQSKSDIPDDYPVPQGLQATMRPYQLDGYRWLIEHRSKGLGACLADDMGLGKTLQTIAVLLDTKQNMAEEEVEITAGAQLDLFSDYYALKRKALRALVIVPASLVYNWYREIRTFAPALQVVRYLGNDRKNLRNTVHTFDVIITTYQTAMIDFNLLNRHEYTYVILDESQQIRNKDTKIFKTIIQLAGRHKISLSGTPIENSLADLWSQMEFINADLLGNYPFYKKRYQTPIEKNRDVKALEELKQIVSPYILRRTKEQVADDLPPLMEQHHYSEMTAEQASLFEKEKSAARNYLLGLNRNDGQFRFHVFSSLMKLRQIANHPVMAYDDYEGLSGKFDDVTAHVKTLAMSGHKTLIFSSFVAHLTLVANWLKSQGVQYVMLTGDMELSKRNEAVSAFQEKDEVRVFLLSIKAGGTGLNLTAADYVMILDPWWNPFAEKQAMARAHRIGQTKNVIVTRYISKDTIEEKIMALQQRKKQLSDDVVGSDDWAGMTVEEMESLLE